MVYSHQLFQLGYPLTTRGSNLGTPNVSRHVTGFSFSKI